MNMPAAMPPAPKPPAKRKKWPWIAAAAAAIVVIATIVGVSAGSSPTASTASTAVSVSTTEASTTDPAAAAASSSAAEAAREAAASQSAASARQSSEAARQSSAAAEAQLQADEENERKAAQITYSVTTTGAGISSVTYLKPGFNMSQVTNVKGKKWSTTIQADGSTLGINMNAQNSGGGTISCKITRGTGEVISENSSSGDYAVVSCG